MSRKKEKTCIVNPFTGRAIIKGGRTYHRIIKDPDFEKKSGIKVKEDEFTSNLNTEFEEKIDPNHEHIFQTDGITRQCKICGHRPGRQIIPPTIHKTKNPLLNRKIKELARNLNIKIAKHKEPLLNREYLEDIAETYYRLKTDNKTYKGKNLRSILVAIMLKRGINIPTKRILKIFDIDPIKTIKNYYKKENGNDPYVYLDILQKILNLNTNQIKKIKNRKLDSENNFKEIIARIVYLNHIGDKDFTNLTKNYLINKAKIRPKFYKRYQISKVFLDNVKRFK